MTCETGQSPSTNSIAEKQSIARTAMVSISLGLLAGVISWGILGWSLGTFFAGFILAATLIPSISLIEARFLPRLFQSCAAVDGIVLIWFFAATTNAVSIIQWICLAGLLIAWMVALFGVASVLERAIRSPIPAAAITTSLALLWLAWPIWFHQEYKFLVQIHPLLALNGIVPHLGLWQEQPIAYRWLMTLGQDVSYGLPRSILPSAAVHAVLGALFLFIAGLKRKR
jgi:hypothetical protein